MSELTPYKEKITDSTYYVKVMAQLFAILGVGEMICQGILQKIPILRFYQQKYLLAPKLAAILQLLLHSDNAE